MLRHDLEAAQIPYTDEAGCVFDFHALRHQFTSSLALAGVHPKVAQQLARHSDINLTMNCYTHLELTEIARALEQIPELPSGLPQQPSEAKKRQTVSSLTHPLTQTSDSECPQMSARDQKLPSTSEKASDLTPLLSES